MSTLMASSADSGFFQSYPVIPPLYTKPSTTKSGSSEKTNVSDEQVFDRILRLYLRDDSIEKLQESIHRFSRLVIHPSTSRLTVDAETNHPTLHPLTTFGEQNKSDPLWTSEGWRGLKSLAAKEGVIGNGSAQPGQPRSVPWSRRVHQFSLVHCWIPSSAFVSCPCAMTDGAAKMLSAHLNDPDGNQPGRQKVLREAYRRLISCNPDDAWTSGQWMTERSGGSNVRGTETVARKLTQAEVEIDRQSGRENDAHNMPLGPWKIDGFKWFSSATDSNMAIMLAQTEKGLSAFYAPTRRASGTEGQSENELNGIRIQRLKDKMGSRGLPTAELELKGTRGWLLGEEGKGIKEISAILNLTRLYAANGGVAFWGRALSVSRAYTRSRSVRDGLLQDNALHLTWLAEQTVQYTAAFHSVMFGVALLGTKEQDHIVNGTRAQALIPEDQGDLDALLRLLTPVLKGQITVRAVAGIRACMESLGGVGYCENNEEGGLLNLARIYRDATVMPIWEGTVNIMAEDTVRVITDRRLGGGDVINNVFANWVKQVLENESVKARFPKEIPIIRHLLRGVVDIVRDKDVAKLRWQGRTLLNRLEAIVSGCLLMYDSSTAPDDVSVEIARRWIQSNAGFDLREESDWKTQVAMDKLIFLGPSSDSGSEIRGKL